jgi:hypothetical protein
MLPFVLCIFLGVPFKAFLAHLDILQLYGHIAIYLYGD